MINVVMVGSVQAPCPEKKFIPKPIHIPEGKEIFALTRRYGAYVKYAETVNSMQTAISAMAEAVRTKRHLDKMRKRWRKKLTRR